MKISIIANINEDSLKKTKYRRCCYKWMVSNTANIDPDAINAKIIKNDIKFNGT